MHAAQLAHLVCTWKCSSRREGFVAPCAAPHLNQRVATEDEVEPLPLVCSLCLHSVLLRECQFATGCAFTNGSLTQASMVDVHRRPTFISALNSSCIARHHAAAYGRGCCAGGSGVLRPLLITASLSAACCCCGSSCCDACCCGFTGWLSSPGASLLFGNGAACSYHSSPVSEPLPSPESLT